MSLHFLEAPAPGIEVGIEVGIGGEVEGWRVVVVMVALVMIPRIVTRMRRDMQMVLGIVVVILTPE